MIEKTHLAPPRATKKPTELTIHGDTRVDDYFWLRERENPEVIDYLNAENTYRESMMAHTKTAQTELYDEMIARIAQTDMSVPYFTEGYWYYSRFEQGKQYPIYCRKLGSLEAEEAILLNVNDLAIGHDYYNVGGMSVSPDNQWLIYGEDTVSRRQYTLRCKHIFTGETKPLAIPNTTGQTVWATDNQTIFYTLNDVETLRPYRVMRHDMTQATHEDDTLIWEEKDDTFRTFVSKTKSKKYLILGSAATVSTEYRFLAADNPYGDWTMFDPRSRDHEYSIAHFGEHFYITSNWEAKNFRLLRCHESATLRPNWEEVIAHRADVLLEGMDIFADFLVLSERRAGIMQLRVRPWIAPQTEHYIAFPEAVYSAAASVNPTFETTLFRLTYTSLTTPNSVFDYDMNARTLVLLKQEAVLDEAFSPDLYQSVRTWTTARDGAKVPVSLVYKKDLFQYKENPLLLYAYGSYGYSMDVYFSSARLSLLNRGFVYAIAHIRGGEEMGRAWYEDGKMLKKKNTFFDFIDCAEHLRNEGFCNPTEIYAMGGSAGGLLMGAVMNLRPDLWRGVVAAVPFVDVVTTMLDETIPLTTGEFDEWGNPKEETYYRYIKSYSPYDNVTAQAYPSTLVTTGLHDSQVQYWEPAKWVAKLRHLKTDQNPLLLYCNMTTGHGGASGRFERYREVAMEYAFLLDLAGKL